jgi:hypothetical protein
MRRIGGRARSPSPSRSPAWQGQGASFRSARDESPGNYVPAERSCKCRRSRECIAAFAWRTCQLQQLASSRRTPTTAASAGTAGISLHRGDTALQCPASARVAPVRHSGARSRCRDWSWLTVARGPLDCTSSWRGRTPLGNEVSGQRRSGGIVGVCWHRVVRHDSALGPRDAIHVARIRTRALTRARARTGTRHTARGPSRSHAFPSQSRKTATIP